MDKIDFCDKFCPMPWRWVEFPKVDNEISIDCDLEESECPFKDVDFSKVKEPEYPNIIGKKRCWVCGSELPLKKIPDGCSIECVKELVLQDSCMADSPSEKAWLCPNPAHLIMWHDRQREACLLELRGVKGYLPNKKASARPGGSF